jgi:3-methyl-2-oxobutanoate hydroxymethyltransferase
MLIDAGADAVKLEGGKEKSQIINFLVQNNIQVMGHIGIKPQSVNNISDYKIVGKNKSEEDNLFEDAKRIELSGAFSVVLELVDSKLSKNISENISIPTIGISSGKYTDGQVQVYNDLIGYSPNILPKHAKVFDNLFEKAQNAIDSFVKETKRESK